MVFRIYSFNKKHKKTIGGFQFKIARFVLLRILYFLFRIENFVDFIIIWKSLEKQKVITTTAIALKIMGI